MASACPSLSVTGRMALAALQSRPPGGIRNELPRRTQRSLERGFLAVQNRLTGEPLEEYIMPVGGGFFFALPGVEGPGRFLGEALVS